MMRVTITGTGTPIMVPGRAGPGVLIETSGGLKLQFDVGRATSLRLTEARVALPDLTAVFITHHHSDHMAGLADLAMSFWLEQWGETTPPLLVHVPDGPAVAIADGVLTPWRQEMEMRAAHTGRSDIARIQVEAFDAREDPTLVFHAGEVTVRAGLVSHEPVVPAVGYHIETPDGAVAISGDTKVCAGLERLAAGCDLLVQEVFRADAVSAGLLSDPESIAAYHSDVAELGAMADRAGVGAVVLTHVIPPPVDAEDKVAVINDIRRAGFHGPVAVADDLDHFELNSRSA